MLRFIFSAGVNFSETDTEEQKHINAHMVYQLKIPLVSKNLIECEAWLLIM